MTHSKHGEHALADVERVPPVMVQNHTVVLPYSQQPPTQSLELAQACLIFLYDSMSNRVTIPLPTTSE